MRWKTHRHEGSHFRFWQVSAAECWRVGFRRTRRDELLFLGVTGGWSVYYTGPRVQLYTGRVRQLTHPSLHRGVAQRRTGQCADNKGQTICGTASTLLLLFNSDTLTHTGLIRTQISDANKNLQNKKKKKKSELNLSVHSEDGMAERWV